MSSPKEIRTRMKSVEQTLKITNAMYLIASSNLRKAKAQLEKAEPYFTRIDETIADILCRSPQLSHPFLDQRKTITPAEREVGYVVVSGDTGLAGAYNHNVLKLAERRVRETVHPKLFVVGLVGRAYFQQRGIPFEEDFSYVVQNPTMRRARDISDELVQRFLDWDLDEVRILYTEMVSPLRLEVRERTLLPLARENFRWTPPERGRTVQPVTYVPSPEAVLDAIVPSGYVRGMVFGALVEAFSSEQSARMTAMESASDNARDMLKKLSLTYNRARQAAITQEITEIAGGAQSARRE